MATWFSHTQVYGHYPCDEPLMERVFLLNRAKDLFIYVVREQ